MRTERYQNDRHFAWYFYIKAPEGRTPFDLTGLDLSLEVQVGLSKTRITDYTVSGNTVDFVFRGRNQKRPGPIIATLYINENQDGMITIDAPAGLMSPNSTPGAPAPGGVETSSGEIVSFLGEWVDDRLIPASIARTSALSAFVTRTVTDLVHYYSKEETYSRAEIEALVGGIRLIPVPVLPEASAATMGCLYLVPSERPRVRNEKDEYITRRSGEEGNYTYEWEQIGSTAIDLSGYVTTAALNQALAEYVTTADLTRLLSGKQDTIEDLQSIRSGAAAGARAYQMPGTGIPKTDLEQGVRMSLGKADTALQEHQDLTPITGLIPSQATPQNQLADKEFVNSSIATATADFKGTFLSLAALQAVTADNNDYGYVVSTDAAGNTVYNRYKYDGSAWTFEYALNNSSFTAAEWAAIQSGITQALVMKLQAIEAGAQVNVLEGIKRNGSALVPVNKVVDMSVPDLSTSIEEDKTSDSKAATPKAVHDITGSLSGLRTAAKNSLVAAINEAAASGGEVEEAPTNGYLYARRNGTWVKAEHLSERGVAIDFGINEDVIGWLNMFGSALTIRRVVATNCATIHVSYGSVLQAPVVPGAVTLPIPVDSPVVWEITRTTDEMKAILAFEFEINSNNS